MHVSRQIGHIHSSFTKVLRDSTAELSPFCALCAGLILEFMAGGVALTARALDAGMMVLVSLVLLSFLIVDVDDDAV